VIRITSRSTGAVIWEGEATSVRAALEKAISEGANLTGANLTYANLIDANLTYANLTHADLTGADLTGADMPDGFASRESAVAMLDQIREMVVAHPETLDMAQWHCGTSHCLAGYAQAISEDPVIRRMHPSDAGIRLIWPASHMFYADNVAAFDFLRDRKYAEVKT
jgi:hypothetical protein